MAICVRFRDNVRREDVGEHTVLLFMLKLVCTLRSTSVPYAVVKVFLFCRFELTYPISLETILTAEVRFLA